MVAKFKIGIVRMCPVHSPGSLFSFCRSPQAGLLPRPVCTTKPATK